MIIPYNLPTVNEKLLQDPHVVILGAGASIAACKEDKHGNRVPSLRGIAEIPEISVILNQFGISGNNISDFESFFSSIYTDGGKTDLVDALENGIRAYFSKLELLDSLTVYDYLLVSLMDKDAIISFNWDPYLVQAYNRNSKVGHLPQLIFPHGNVAVKVCPKCKRSCFAKIEFCPTCSERLTELPLLYPIGQKNYSSSESIKHEWEKATDYISRAKGVTVFGYSAPVTDSEAVALMQKAYSVSNAQDIAPFTLINLASEKDEQLNRWSSFFSDRMVQFCEQFYESMLWESPRVSLETLFDAILYQRPRKTQKPFRCFSSLDELHAFVNSINEFEMSNY